MTSIDREKVLLECQLAILQEVVKSFMEKGKISNEDVADAVDEATEKLKMKAS